jgi:hypothetical protein
MRGRSSDVVIVIVVAVVAVIIATSRNRHGDVRIDTGNSVDCMLCLPTMEARISQCIEK